jgi:endo-1,4-beta-xylanase
VKRSRIAIGSAATASLIIIVSACSGPTILSDNNLSEAYREFFTVGAAVNEQTVDSHSELVRDHFNSITCENEMMMRGHTFVWHQYTPEWIFKFSDTTVSREILRESSWLSIIGDDYIAEAFHIARVAAPDAILFYNDYNVLNPGKQDRIFSMLEKLPADGIGM